MLQTVGLKTAIWNNNIRSFLLLALYPPLLAAVIWACTFAVLYTVQVKGGSYTSHHTYQSQDYGAVRYSAPYPDAQIPLQQVIIQQTNALIWEYGVFILGGVLLWFAVAWLLHGRMLRAMSGAHRVTRDEEPELYNLLENLCISRGLNVPKLSVIETHARNAFASGISEDTYEITVTRGLMNALKRDEVEAVLAHELTHIINRDVRLLVISVIFVGIFGFFTQTTWRILRGMSRTRSRGKGSGQVMLILLAIGCILGVGYMATLLTRFALSRRREYMADAGAVELTKNPDALIRALQRIAGRETLPDVSADIKMMCIHNHQAFLGVMATHPPLEQRINELAMLNGLERPAIYTLPPAGPEEAFQPQAQENIHPKFRIRSRTPWQW